MVSICSADVSRIELLLSVEEWTEEVLEWLLYHFDNNPFILPELKSRILEKLEKLGIANVSLAD